MLSQILHYELLPEQGKKTPLIARTEIPNLDKELFPVFLTSRFDGTFLPVPNVGQKELGSGYFKMKRNSESQTLSKLHQALIATSLKYGLGNVINRSNLDGDTYIDVLNFFRNYDVPLHHIQIDNLWANRCMAMGKLYFRKKVREPDEPLPWELMVKEPKNKKELEFQLYNTNTFITWGNEEGVASFWTDPPLVGSYLRSGDHVTIFLHNLTRGFAIVKYHE
jgi:hypothetical protein